MDAIETWTGEFWQYLEHLAAEKVWVIDRPRGSAHPRYPDMVYPLDYGYLECTAAMDGGGIDIWVGSVSCTERRVSGILCTVDLHKGDTEVKILIGCSSQDVETILAFINGYKMRAIYIERKEYKGGK